MAAVPPAAHGAARQAWRGAKGSPLAPARGFGAQPHVKKLRSRLIDGLLVVYFVEVGLVLIVAPWTTYWDRNYFVEALPSLQPLLTSHAVRGAIAGIGVVSLVAALAELAATIQRVRMRRAAQREFGLLTAAVPRSRPS